MLRTFFFVARAHGSASCRRLDVCAMEPGPLIALGHYRGQILRAAAQPQLMCSCAYEYLTVRTWWQCMQYAHGGSGIYLCNFVAILYWIFWYTFFVNLRCSHRNATSGYNAKRIVSVWRTPASPAQRTSARWGRRVGARVTGFVGLRTAERPTARVFCLSQAFECDYVHFKLLAPMSGHSLFAGFVRHAESVQFFLLSSRPR